VSEVYQYAVTFDSRATSTPADLLINSWILNGWRVVSMVGNGTANDVVVVFEAVSGDALNAWSELRKRAIGGN
jgi:hypothetical protein